MNVEWQSSVFEEDPEKGIGVYPIKKMDIKGTKLPPRVYALSLVRGSKVWTHIVIGTRLEDAMVTAQIARAVLETKGNPSECLTSDSFVVASSTFVDVNFAIQKTMPIEMTPAAKSETREVIEKAMEDTTPENKEYRKVIWLKAVKAEDAKDDYERRVIQAIINRLENVKPQKHESKT